MGDGHVEAEVLAASCGFGTRAPHYVFGRVFYPSIHGVFFHLPESDGIVVAGRAVVHDNLRGPAIVTELFL